jgi:hypothetical protein
MKNPALIVTGSQASWLASHSGDTTSRYYVRRGLQQLRLGIRRRARNFVEHPRLNGRCTLASTCKVSSSILKHGEAKEMGRQRERTHFSPPLLRINTCVTYGGRPGIALEDNSSTSCGVFPIEIRDKPVPLADRAKRSSG